MTRGRPPKLDQATTEALTRRFYIGKESVKVLAYQYGISEITCILAIFKNQFKYVELRKNPGTIPEGQVES